MITLNLSIIGNFAVMLIVGVLVHLTARKVIQVAKKAA